MEAQESRTYLGYANGWCGTPALVKEAEAKGYKLVESLVGNCLHRYDCEELNFYYLVDSGD